jgi:hypothetical protein
MELLRSLGAEVVEKTETRNPFSNTSHDLFGFIDVLACLAGKLTAVQATTIDHLSHRRNKILASEKARAWTKCGGLIWIIVWGQAQENNRQGLPVGRWYHKIEEVTFT